MKKIVLILFLIMFLIGCRKDISHYIVSTQKIIALQFISNDKKILKGMVEDYSNSQIGDRYVLQVIEKDENTIGFRLVKDK